MVKKNLKIYIFRLFLKEKTEKSDQKVGNVFDQFGIAIPCSATYFLKVSARLSLKVATKGSISGKKNLKIYIFRKSFYSKNGGVWTKSWKDFSSV